MIRRLTTDPEFRQVFGYSMFILSIVLVAGLLCARMAFDIGVTYMANVSHVTVDAWVPMSGGNHAIPV